VPAKIFDCLSEILPTHLYKPSRLLREAFRAEYGHLKSPCAIVLVPKQADEYSLENFRKGLRAMFKKVVKENRPHTEHFDIRFKHVPAKIFDCLSEILPTHLFAVYAGMHQ